MAKQSTATAPTTRSILVHTDFPQGWQWFGKLVIRLLVSGNRRRALRAGQKRLPVLDATIETVRAELLKAGNRHFRPLRAGAAEIAGRIYLSFPSKKTSFRAMVLSKLRAT